VNQLRLSRKHESHHFMVNGDTGSGKSQFIKQILYHAQACGDTAVVLDSKLEFQPEFYDASRGDLILSPKDERCPYWHIGEEVTDEADAISVTRAMYPTHPNNPQSQFFDDTANEVAAYLLTYSDPRPTCNEYGYWLAHPDEIHKRIKGSEHEHTMTKSASNQLAGILGTLNKAGRPLRMMPTDRENRTFFTVREWCKHRRGWIFLPNTQDTREAMRPLQSMWMDLILLRLLSMGDRHDLPRVWIIMDELASLNTLPQLHTAITEMRGTGNPIVMGMQNIADLEALYGKKSETIFSQAYSKVVLATSDGRSAKSLSELLGDVEIERPKETRSYARRGNTRTFTTERVREPLLMASEIQGLPDLSGYLIQRGKMVKLNLPYLPPQNRAVAIIERRIPPMAQRPLVPEENASTTTQDESVADQFGPKKVMIGVPKRPRQQPLEGTV
jgi:hypothetical protein